MISLTQISEYVAQTASIIGNVIGLDVLIIDKSLLIIGDSALDEVIENSCIKKESILSKVMDNQKNKVLRCKDDNEGCLNCPNRKNCVVEMIIGIPIFYENHVIGSVGVIASTPNEKQIMLKNQDQYIMFIDRMIELLVNKLKEEKAFEEVSLLKKRMEVLIDSVDQFLLLVTSTGKILQTNDNFNKIYRRKVPSDISEIFNEKLVEQIINKHEEINFKEVTLNKKFKFLLSTKPVNIDDHNEGAIIILRSIKDVTNEMNKLYSSNMDVVYKDLIGESKAILAVKERIQQISTSSSTVLIYGETGTGKEVVARLIHNTSKRKNGPFVAINCSAIPEDLMESELFGYEEGAFSGARKGGKIGKFQLAEGGTLFLDEIGEMALHLQSKLLRVLQERQISKIGGLESIPIDVRILVATNKNLDNLVKNNRFREDLFYRLKVIPLTIPPLREREGDIELLLNHYITYYSEKMEKNVYGISDDALVILKEYFWKGNVRELRNIIEFSINVTRTDMITLADLPYDITKLDEEVVEDLNIELHTKILIEKALKKYGDTTLAKEMAARALGISIATLYRKMKEFGL